MGIEKKYLDTWTNESTISVDRTSCLVAPEDQANIISAGALNSIGFGSNYYQREGQKVTNSSLHVRGVVKQSTTTQSEDFRVLLIIVLDKQPNQTANSSNDNLTKILKFPHGNNYPEQHFTNIEYVRRYKILWKKIIDLPASAVIVDTAGTGYINPKEHVKKFKADIPLKGIQTIYDTDSTAVGSHSDICTNAIRFYALASGSNGSTHIQASYRLRYYG